jgi:hypothetical protein
MSVWWLTIALGGIAVQAPGGGIGQPSVGEPVRLTITDDADHPLPGQTVRVVHRPGLALEREQAIGITDARGQVEWTPAAAGLARLRAGDRVQPVQVAAPFPIPTASAAFVLLVLGLGALGWGLRAGGWPGGRR